MYLKKYDKIPLTIIFDYSYSFYDELPYKVVFPIPEYFIPYTDFMVRCY